MAARDSYRIVCVETEFSAARARTATSWLSERATTHTPSRPWTVAQVRAALRKGTKFHTKGPSSGKVADVDPDQCCGVLTLKSTNDSGKDNNLDDMRACAWKRASQSLVIRSRLSGGRVAASGVAGTQGEGDRWA